MIVGRNTSPNFQVYNIGALILAVFKEKRTKNISVIEMYELVKTKQKISISLFSLGLDWLFILGAVKNDKGKIVLCS
jgi:hypothetical protein